MLLNEGREVIGLASQAGFRGRCMGRCPAEVVRGSADWERRPARDIKISFAVDIDYRVELMRARGLFEHD